MYSYKLDVLGVSEVRWKQFREIKYCGGKGRGCENDGYKEGVGILMTKAVRRSITERHPVSERLLIARFRTSIWNISITQCYAPTEGGTAEQKKNNFILS
jgi:hypothetical protein